ncbi:MAG: cysteine--tRNA ligase [Anaerolineae bacterium]|nr:cysteine--tRNA ligase [Anaerolineae bacterium]
MALKIYNYLSRKMERFRPVNDGRVHMYVCGPTVYDHSHLGHAKTYVAMDVVVRYFKYRGYQVRYVRNLTDVGHLLDSGEDRITKGARRDRIEPMEVVDTYIKSFHDDMDTLGVLRPSISPRATCHIPEIIKWVQGLLDWGYAYESEGNVYFSIEKFPEYGKLANRKLDDLEAGARVDVREEKHHPSDFALWKRAEPEHIMRWDSPWGEGYPGWHIECSVMATKYLGQPFDIHGGGLENIFPHNECEIAQAESYHQGVPFANYWILVGSLTVNGMKMSKSLGNSLTIQDALKLYSPEALRYFILSSHYRGPIDFSRDALQAAQRGMNRMLNTVQKLRFRMDDALPAGTAILAQVAALEDYREDFNAALDDDFNTPQALATLFEFTREVNRQLDENDDISMGTLSAMDKIFRDLAGTVLGILPENLEERLGGALVGKLVDTLVELREEYRASREWSKADTIRSRLNEMGIVLEDSPEGTTWRLK